MDIGQMIETAVEQMVAQGRKRLAMLCGHDPWEQSDAAREERQRVMDIFANTVASRGARTQADWIRADFRPTSPGAGYSQFREMWTGAAGRPDGLLVLDEVLFSDTATAILEMGIRVPEQLMVVTHSNEGSGILYPFPAARMEFDMEEVARGIGVLLRRAMSHEPIQEPRIKALFRWIDAAPAKRKRLAPENPNQPALHHL
jgi:DNA-binding LacI/PurR family transcriptional regulator